MLSISTKYEACYRNKIGWSTRSTLLTFFPGDSLNGGNFKFLTFYKDNDQRGGTNCALKKPSNFQYLIFFFPGDSFNGGNFKFSTFDNDNDQSGNRNCAHDFQTGWWLSMCGFSDLNGPLAYSQGQGHNELGITWYTFAQPQTDVIVEGEMKIASV